MAISCRCIKKVLIEIYNRAGTRAGKNHTNDKPALRK